MKHVITEAQRVAILSGATDIDLPDPTPTPTATPAATPAAPAAPVVQAAAPAAQTQVDPGVKYLETRLSTVEGQLVESKAEVTQLKAAAEQSEANAKLVPALLDIVRADIGRMQVALGGQDTSATMDAAAAIAEHEKTKKAFIEKLPAGQVSRQTTTVQPESNASNVLEFERRMQSVKK